MLRFWFLVVLSSLLVAPAFADDGTFLSRVDLYRGSEPSYTQAVMLPEIEFWGFTVPGNPDIEVGRLWPVYKRRGLTVRAGGYGVYWTNSHKWFLMPYTFTEYQHGKLDLSADFNYYQPVNGGPTILYADEAWVGYRVCQRLQVGGAGSFFLTNGHKLVAGIGPAIRFEVNKKTSLEVRCLRGVKGQSSLRLQVMRGF